MTNLTKNALKFTVNGSIKIVTAYDYASEHLKVHVIDTGQGIEQNEMDQIFQQFGRVDRTSGMNRDGVGLGLNICQRILEQFDGELRVFSAGQNLGSTFMFSMRMNVHKEEPLQLSEDEKFESAALSGKF